MAKPIMLVMVLLMLVSIIFASQGVVMHTQVSDEEAKFHGLQGEYFNLDKQTRDSAPEGSELNQDLVEIKNYPSELLRLKLVGVGKLLTGIYVLLFGILIALVMMPVRLAKLIKKKK
jgi:ABC-type phosphate/phosphonate transport system permease subunit